MSAVGLFVVLTACLVGGVLLALVGLMAALPASRRFAWAGLSALTAATIARLLRLERWFDAKAMPPVREGRAGS